ncbi:NAD(P)-dependent alcohol dehydrogenase [Cohnella terricola]|uniref:NAD(P)-dependent alcohol dehydrogenase n=1 Tax=Cohnella terricola TaxID=1289167 RepID=A0A559J4M5_9BACL|nr:NAD(P)-dependent alcohol dehydrogenase [Cohnella terricola]TVX94791.1 NAD(P)-dependent alcohol dehydrogenase [Cohnella terricola]
MNAMVCTQYGREYAFSPKEFPLPVPKDHELLVRIHATTVASGDVVRAKLGGFMKSKTGVLGQEFAGVVTAIGSKVTKYRVNDRVFGIVSTNTHAEYMTVSEKASVGKIPESVTFDAAASLPFGANTALHFLRKLCHIRKDQQVLIHGASGAIGTFAVQYAKYVGAEVTGVCSAKNLELVRKIGADEVIDYTQEDFRSRNKRYDIIFNTVGHLPYGTVKHLLKDKGIYATTYLNGPLVARSVWSRMFGGKKVKCGIVLHQPGNVDVVSELLAQGAVQGVIDSIYPLHELAQAFRLVEQGHKTGSVIIHP